jgi:hypothetical protein
MTKTKLYNPIITLAEDELLAKRTRCVYGYWLAP